MSKVVEKDRHNATDDKATGGEKAAREGQKIQHETEAKEKAHGAHDDQNKDFVPPTSERDYPKPPYPEQHQAKPGQESKLDPAPLYLAPHYKGSAKLNDMVAIITGGDSGIGRSVAVLYAREGADIAIVYLNEHKDAETTQRAVEHEGRRCILFAGDVSDPKFCKQVVQETLHNFGHLDILVNNAAFQEHVQKFEDLSDEHFDHTLKTNLYGYFYMARAVVPYMNPGSSIVMTGSVTAFEGSKNLLDYSMTKGGIHTFAKSLAANLVSRGIRVNVVAPGPVWTPLNAADQAPEKVAQFGTQTTMKRAAQPEEISPAYVFLAAPCCSSYITGEVFPLTGGHAH